MRPQKQEETLFDIMRDPKPDETSRFLSILDSPTNAETMKFQRSQPPTDFSNVFTNHINSKSYVDEGAHKWPCFPTKVVIAKNLPPTTNEFDLYTVWGIFGVVTKVQISQESCTALVQFETKQGAQKSVNSSIEVQGPMIKKNRIIFEFTGHEMIEFFEDSDTTNEISKSGPDHQ